MSIPKITLQIAPRGAAPGVHKTFTQRTIKLGKLSSSHFFVPDEDASRMQALIEVADDGSVQIIDLSSLHGTYVNGKKVTKGPLADGDVIAIGTTAIAVGIEAIAAPAPSPSTATDEDATEDTLDRPATPPAEPRDWFDATMDKMDRERVEAEGRVTQAAARVEDLLEKTKASAAQREATRAERLAKKAECDADRTLAVALLYEAVHRAENFAHELAFVPKAVMILDELPDSPEKGVAMAILTAREQVAEEALPALLDLRKHRERLLAITNLVNELEEPSNEELWTTAAAGALAISPYLFTWRSIVAKVEAEAAGAAVDPTETEAPP